MIFLTRGWYPKYINDPYNSTATKQIILLKHEKTWTLSKEDAQMALSYEKVLGLTSYQGNANRHHREPPPHSCQNGHYQQDVTSARWRKWEKGTPVRRGWDCQWPQPLRKTAWRCLEKLKIKLSHDPAIPLPGIYPNKTKTLIWKDTRTPTITAALFITAEIRKRPGCPSTNQEVVHIHNGPSLGQKRRKSRHLWQHRWA